MNREHRRARTALIWMAGILTAYVAGKFLPDPFAAAVFAAAMGMLIWAALRMKSDFRCGSSAARQADAGGLSPARKST